MKTVANESMSLILFVKGKWLGQHENVQFSILTKINRTYHRSSMQIEKSHFEGERIMPETRFTYFRHYPLTRGLEFLGLHRRPMIDYFS